MAYKIYCKSLDHHTYYALYLRESWLSDVPGGMFDLNSDVPGSMFDLNFAFLMRGDGNRRTLQGNRVYSCPCRIPNKNLLYKIS